MANRIPHVVFLVFVISVATLLSSGIVTVGPTTWTVDDDDPSADFSTIMDAVNAAGSGDTILVKSGKYYERVVVNKPISIIGEIRETTIVDAGGFGTTLRISKSGVAVRNLTLTNAGRNWGPPQGQGFPDSVIAVSSVSNVQIENNILFDAAVCVWIAYSYSVSIADNVVLEGVYGGIIGYDSSNLSILRNYVDSCGLMGIHLDGSSSCVIANSLVMNNLEGLELESGSSANQIEWNTFTNNNASVVLNECGSGNSFRGNAMNSGSYNFVVVGYEFEAFLQDIDSSNTVNKRLVYYLTNLRDQDISPLDYPNAGWLALVNCSNVAVRDFDLFGNGDGILLAYSSGCAMSSLIIGGNRKPLLWGGFALYNSNDNSIMRCSVTGNTIGLAFYQSYMNSFVHNSFVDNDRQTMSDFLTPFSNASSGYVSTNIWDNGYEGNYWSDYIGMDADKNGIGDIPYVIDVQNVDQYPLLSPPPTADTDPPIVSIISPTFGEVIRSSAVTISWEGFDYGSGINHYEIAIDSEYMINIGLNTSYLFTDLADGSHQATIEAFDNVGNAALQSWQFIVNTGGGFSWPPYTAEAAGAIAVVIALGIAIYVWKGRYPLWVRKPSRRLIR